MLSLFILLVCVSASLGQLFTQVCHPNGTVQVINPDPSLYVSVFAVQNPGYANAKICTATMSGATVTVTDCDINEEINIFMSDRPASDGATFVGGNWISYCAFCSDLSQSGAERTVYNLLGATLEVTTQDPVTPSFTISSALRETGPTGAVAYSAEIGDTLWWTIDIPSEYNGRPSCTAYPGTDNSGSPSKLLFDAGCSQDDYTFASDFDNIYIAGVKRLWVQFYVFKFYNSDDIYFACSVRLCPSSSAGCDLSCNKRKRSVFGVKRNAADKMVEGNDDVVLKANNVLHVVSRAENSSITNLGLLWILAVALCAWV